jgi:predicted RNase H-like HicB family nuclease
MNKEIIFEVHSAQEGGFFARALGHSIFTEAETWDELRTNAIEATELHFDDSSYLCAFNVMTD